LTISGNRVYRPAPEFKEAMRLSYMAWITFLSQWIAESGANEVRAILRENLGAVRARFSSPMPFANAMAAKSVAKRERSAKPKRRK
jgi:hypothetical protein